MSDLVILPSDLTLLVVQIPSSVTPLFFFRNNFSWMKRLFLESVLRIRKFQVKLIDAKSHGLMTSDYLLLRVNVSLRSLHDQTLLIKLHFKTCTRTRSIMGHYLYRSSTYCMSRMFRGWQRAVLWLELSIGKSYNL